MAVLAVHDLSCYSKSSLTVVLPVLEALSVETAVLPTALLSTQTDGFDDIYVKDNLESMKAILCRFEKLGISFDGIYTGYIDSADEIELVRSFVKDVDAPLLVDPVMGDGGELYQTVGKDVVASMIKLVRKGDIITPNWTEAEIITELGYGKGKVSQRMILDEIKVLRSLGPAKGVITGIPLEAGGLGNAAWDGDEVRLFQYEDEGVSYPGSGDLFASLLFGLVMKGDSFFSAALNATNTATYAVHMTKKNGRERRLGIMLKPVMDEIRRRML